MHHKSETGKWPQLWLAALMLAVMLLGGCETTRVDPVQTELDEQLLGLRVGDNLKITFAGSSQVPPEHEDQVREDGSINPPMIGAIPAAGKTPRELGIELEKAYSKFFNNLSIIVRATDWHYTVGGEVRSPGRLGWVGGSTVVKAVKAAGDITDFANRKRVVVTRANGRTFQVNYQKALENPEYDRPVYPGDIIHVPRRIW